MNEGKDMNALKLRMVKLEERRKADVVKNSMDHRAIKVGISEVKKLVGNHLAHAKWFNCTVTGAFIVAVAPYLVQGIIKVIKLL